MAPAPSRLLALLVVAVLVVGCRGVLRLRASAPPVRAKVGLGAKYVIGFSASLEGCGHGSDGLLCLPLAIGPMVMGDFTVDDPRVATIEALDRSQHGQVRVSLRALAPGVTVLRGHAVSGSGASSAEVAFEVVPVDGVKVTAVDPCGGQPAPWRLSPGTGVRADVVALQRGVAVQGSDYQPPLVELGPGPFKPVWESSARVSFIAEAAAGTSVLRSRVDPSLQVELTTFTAQEADPVQASLTPDGCDAAQLNTVVTVQRAPTCASAVVATIETPEVCSFSEGDALSSLPVGVGRRVFARGVGRCRLAVGLQGGTRVEHPEVTFGQCTGWQLLHPSQGMTSVSGTGPSDVWALGPRDVVHFDGKAWTPARLPNLTVDPRAEQVFESVYAAAPNDVWVSGTPDAVLHFDGARWSLERLPAELGRSNPYTGSSRVVGSGPGDVWLQRGDRLAHRGADGRWVLVATLEGAVTASGGPGVVLGLGREGAFRHDGAQQVPLGGPRGGVLWRDAAGGVWVDSNGAFSHLEGTSWARKPAPVSSQLMGLCGSSPRDVFALPSSGPTVHFDGGTWQLLAAPAEPLRACWAADAQHVYAVGSRGVFRLRR